VAGRVLLDTSVVIAFFADDKTIRERVTQTHFVLSSTVLGELYYGLGNPTVPPAICLGLMSLLHRWQSCPATP
jgi:hypothetical protein